MIVDFVKPEGFTRRSTRPYRLGEVRGSSISAGQDIDHA